jgi:hypothetical protein
MYLTISVFEKLVAIRIAELLMMLSAPLCEYRRVYCNSQTAFVIDTYGVGIYSR